MKTTKQQPAREWSWLFGRFPLGPTELAEKLGVSRQALHNLQHVAHARAPVDLLAKLAKVVERCGMADGSKPPTRHELVRSWFAAKGAQ